MKPKNYTYAFAALNATGYAENVSGATWTLTANTPGDDAAHQVTIYNDSATDHTGKTATIIGTDANGYVITESLALPDVNGGGSDTTTSTNYYKTVTSITPSATIGADTMDLGWTEACVTIMCPVDYHSSGPLVSCDIGGTINYTPQKTNSPIYTDTTPDWHTATAAGTVDTMTQYPDGCTAVRVLINSHTTGTLSLTISQAD